MWVAHVLDSQVSTCVSRSSPSSVLLMGLERLCLSVGIVQSPHSGLLNVTHQIPLCLSSSGQALITSPAICILSRSHLFSTNRLSFMNQPFVHHVPAQRPTRHCQAHRFTSDHAACHSRRDLLSNHNYLPQINRSATDIQMLCGNTEI